MPIISALDLRDSLGLSEKNTYQGEASPEASRAVHGDAIRLTRGELKWALPCLTAGAILAVITSFRRWFFLEGRSSRRCSCFDDDENDLRSRGRTTASIRSTQSAWRPIGLRRYSGNGEHVPR